MVININKALIKCLKGSILDLVERCLCLSYVLYFSSIHIEGQRTKIFSCVLREQKREQIKPVF